MTTESLILSSSVFSMASLLVAQIRKAIPAHGIRGGLRDHVGLPDRWAATIVKNGEKADFHLPSYVFICLGAWAATGCFSATRDSGDYSPNIPVISGMYGDTDKRLR